MLIRGVYCLGRRHGTVLRSGIDSRFRMRWLSLTCDRDRTKGSKNELEGITCKEALRRGFVDKRSPKSLGSHAELTSPTG